MPTKMIIDMNSRVYRASTILRMTRKTIIIDTPVWRNVSLLRQKAINNIRSMGKQRREAEQPASYAIILTTKL
jgi:hypothetical protein